MTEDGPHSEPSDGAAPVALFVDDSPEFLAGLRRSLRSATRSWSCEFLTSAREALARTEQLAAAVLVVDWNMPEMDGPRFCQCLRERAREHGDRHYYIILLTGLDGAERAVHALESGADDFVSKPVDPRELIARLRVGWRLVSTQRELWLTNRKLEMLATTDPLTGLSNRRIAEEVLEQELARVDRGLNWLSVCMIDLDHFKRINDSHGHAAGDAALVHVAAILDRSRRSYDRVARWGGEEFLVICPDHNPTGGEEVGQRIRQAIAASPVTLANGASLDVTASVGVATASAGLRCARDTIVDCADRALYAAKTAGRNCVRRTLLE